MRGGIVLRLAATIYSLSAVAFGAVATYNGSHSGDSPTGSHGNSYHGGGQEELMPTILLALQEGAAGESTLRAWSRWAEEVVSSHRTPPAVRVICTDPTVAGSVLQLLPHVEFFLVGDESSWTAALGMFLTKNPRLPGVVGLLGEGALPHPGLMDSMESMGLALLEAVPPTAVLTRSRSRGDTPGEEERWLSDSFVSQLWCHGAAMEASVLTKSGLDTLTLKDATLLQVLRCLIRDAAEKRLVLVDGTHMTGSVFDASSPETASSGGSNMHIGSLGFALAYDVGDSTAGQSDLRGNGSQAATVKTSSIVKAPWPPAYILETVAMNTSATVSKGLALVSNVNCGYLDMATNFWRSVQSTSDAKVLFVAMDEVSFEFMDALDPGCAALFPSPAAERHHSVKAGRWGDSIFAKSVLVRPKILQSILNQDYAVLWSDSDIVWLDNPLSLLPRLDNTTEADVLLQYDGAQDNKCTCFMFLKPTMTCRMLLELWEAEIAKRWTNIDQKAFQKPLAYMRGVGLRVDFLSPEVMPAGKHFFNHPYETNYVQMYHEHATTTGSEDTSRRRRDSGATIYGQ